MSPRVILTIRTLEKTLRLTLSWQKMTVPKKNKPKHTCSILAPVYDGEAQRTCVVVFLTNKFILQHHIPYKVAEVLQH